MGDHIVRGFQPVCAADDAVPVPRDPDKETTARIPKETTKGMPPLERVPAPRDSE